MRGRGVGPSWACGALPKLLRVCFTPSAPLFGTTHSYMSGWDSLEGNNKRTGARVVENAKLRQPPPPRAGPRPPRRRIVSPPWRTRRPIGPIATELSQPCGQADWIHHRHTQSHIYSRYEINKARICSADRPKCTSAGARPHTGKPSIPTPRRLHKATDYGTHPGGSRGR